MPGIEIERAKQVFRFLKAFAERKLPLRRQLAEQPWQMPLRDLPKHASIEIGRVSLGDGTTSPQVDGQAEQTALLRVRRPKIAVAPSPPAILRDWVKQGWEDPEGTITTVDSREFERGGQLVKETFTADARRPTTLGQWRASWELWASSERPARQAMRVFERLYELWGRIERESENVELLLGDGRLRWRTGEDVIDHPVLLQRVELLFDATVPEFCVVDTDRPPEIYGSLLQAGDGLTSAKLNALRTELEQGGYHPLAGPETNAFLRRLAALLHAQGTFSGQHVQVPAADEPVVMRDPVLFLRARLSGFPAAFERILIELENGRQLPVALTRLVGVEPAPPVDDVRQPTSPWAEPPDVLLSKPANQEQVQIARALDRHRAVLVQGPPGTGKSHTIANLIGHLVAQGKRVLVTSHTTKALRVLREQIVEPLRPLAVAVLDRDLESREQMEKSVRDILSRLTDSTEEALDRDAASLRERRAKLNAEIERLTTGLREVRSAEYLPVGFAGEDLDPAEAARWVAANQKGNDWIPGPIQRGAPLPLSVGELPRLYELNGLLNAADEAQINAQLPDMTALPDARSFHAWVTTPRVEERAAMARLWLRRAQEGDIALLERLRRALADTAADLQTFKDWQLSLVKAGHAGEAEQAIWEELAKLVRDAHEVWTSHRSILMRFQVQAQSSIGTQVGLATVREMLRYLEGSEAIGRLQYLLHPRWRTLTQSFRVDDRPPATADHFRAITAYLEIEVGRDKLGRRWARQAEPIGLSSLPNMGAQPELAASQLVGGFSALTHWWESRWRAIVDLARDSGLQLEAYRQVHLASVVDSTPFERDIKFVQQTLVRVVEVRLAMASHLRAERELRELETLLAGYESKGGTALLNAVRARDAAAYDLAYTELARVVGKYAVWQERRDLTAKLGHAAPGWADALRSRSGFHGGTSVPDDAGLAWRWRQIQQELERRAALDEVILTRQLEQRRKGLRECTAELIDRQAWLAQLRRTDLAARQALQGWADTVRKIGKGTGKRAPELQARARELLATARNAVPVWIMPLGRVAESFDPAASRFDVVIVDEASQSDIQGLLAWYLADRIAVVGDHEQVSPMAVGQELGTVKALIDQHLPDVPNRHLYDGTTSVYDLGRQCFGGTIALREHFRCVPDIIEFSNELSYNFEIRPLRNPGTAARPHVTEFTLPAALGVRRDGKTNVAEARATAALMAAAMGHPEYRKKSFGAITLLGDEQAVLIQQLALELIGATQLDARRFVAGNSAQFQGDERDVIFLSMVDVPGEGVLRISQTPAMKQRYNVAASRARDQLWLVHSLDPNRDLQAGDLRRRLIDHVRDPSARRRELRAASRKVESPFEQAVLERLHAAHYQVEPQVWVGRYRIDLVVRNGSNEVAVECDGDRYHGFDNIIDDMNRQAVLERAGWRFVRIRGTRFYRDPDRTMQEVFANLKALRIEPGRATVPAAHDDNVLRQEVVRRAWELMRERGWVDAASDDTQSMAAASR